MRLRSLAGRLGIALALVGLAAGLAAPPEDLFEFQKVAEGVYMAKARDQSLSTLNCNAAVIINEEDVIVVDTHSKPSAARALIEGIARITPKPVRYVINSHFHWDHVQGNEAYPPGVEIVSTVQTRENLKKFGAERVREQLDGLPGEIEKLKARLQGADPGKAQGLSRELAMAESFLAELKDLRITLPTITFDTSLILHRKDRDIYLLYLGRGHTDGDIIVYLPKEKVIATGDFLHGGMPYMRDCFPKEWVETLRKTEALDFVHFIGGHGGVGNRERLVAFRGYLAALIDLVEQEARAGKPLEEVKKSARSKLGPEYSRWFPGFGMAVDLNVEKMYAVATEK